MTVPAHLVDALADRNVIVCVGPLLAEAAGLPGPRALAGQLAARLEDGRAAVDRLIEKGELARALERIEALLSPAAFTDAVQPLLDRDDAPTPAAIQALVVLAPALNLVLTTNLDAVIERAFAGALPALDAEPPDLGRRTRLLFKICGSAARPASWRLTRRGLDRCGDDLPQVVSLLRTNVVLWIGYRPDDEIFADVLLELRAPETADAARPDSLAVAADLALVPADDLTREARDFLADRGIELAPIRGDYDAGVAAFLRELAGEYQRRRMAVAHRLVRDLLHDVVPMLSAIPGTADARRVLHDGLKRAIEALRLEADDDVELLRSQLAEHWHRGELARRHDNVALAREEFAAASQIAERILAVLPDDLEAHAHAGAAQRSLGEAAELVGDAAAARAHFERAHRHAATILASDPKSARGGFLFTFALESLGRVELALGDLPAARAAFDAARQAAEARLARGPNATASHLLARALLRLAQVAVATGDEADAHAGLERARGLLDALAATSPGDMQIQLDRGHVSLRLGEHATRTGDPVAAERHFTDAWQRYESAATSDRENLIVLNDAAICIERLGAAALAAGDLERARVHLERALQLAEKLAAIDPRRAWPRKLFALTARRLGDLEVAAGDLDRARSRYERALELADAVAPAEPELDELVAVLAKLAEVELHTQHPGPARDHLTRLLPLAERRAQEAQDDPARRCELAAALVLTGMLEIDAGAPLVAVGHLERAHTMAQELAATRPDPQHQRLLLKAHYQYAASLIRAADLAIAANDLAVAREQAGRGLALAVSLRAAVPDDGDVGFAVVLGHAMFVQLADQEGRADELREHLVGGIAVLDEMDARGQIAGVPVREQVLAQARAKLATLP